jgi:diadenosine tetraphosphate (Ap4A) HIT family hydrolase
MANTDCLFCRKIAELGEQPEPDVVGQFPHSVAILSEWQFYQGYCILFSRTHATELSQLDNEERRAFLDEMCLLARALETCFRPRKLNYELLGNQVPHLHWHIIPRYTDDPDHLQPVWLALERAKHDPMERRRLQTGKVERAQILHMLQRKLSEP